METCTPYGCELVVVFGILIGIVILPSIWLGGVAYFWVRDRVNGVVLARKQAALDKEFPTWRNTVNSRKFRDWYAASRPEVHQLGESWAVADALEVLRRFEKAYE